MTEKKRFELNWEDDEMCNVYDNQIESHISVEEVEELLNVLYEQCKTLEKENMTIKNTIKEQMNNERTHLGYNALKQLAENLEIL